MTVYMDTNIFVYWLTAHPIHGGIAKSSLKQWRLVKPR